MNRLCRIIAAGVLTAMLWIPARAQDGATTGRSDRLEAHRARGDSLIDWYAQQVDKADMTRGGYIHIAARLHREQDLDWVLARLDTLLQQPRGDMFWMYPFTLVMYLGRDRLPGDYKARMRDLWRTYTPYRGDTENHWAMYYASLYLVAQLYPGEPGERWFTGKSSEENREEARAYLLHWMDLTTTIGQGEYDSPTYLSFFVVPMALLYAYAEDPAMRQRARMMLDYLLADFAVESLNGVHTGASSRIYPQPLLNRWANNSTGFAWLLFGNTPFRPRGEAMILALSGYEPPDVLHHIATDRSQPYVHRELKRTRDRIRHSAIRNAPVYKYTYMRREYAVGSTQGGLLQPIQQHTWEVQWALDDPREGYNLLFTTHPYSSPYEGTMYFAEPWHMVTELIVRSKTEYDSPDKWTGGSPYEQVVQHEDAVIALYDLPPGTRFPHISGFFSRRLSAHEEDDSGWIFARGGDAFIAYYPLAPYVWRQEADGSRRLHSPHRKNGAVVQVAPASEYASFDAFKEAIRALPLEATTEPTPHVRFTTLRGAVLEASYGTTPTVNSVPVDYEHWPLFDGPFLYAEKGSRTLEMRYGPLRRVLDFNTLTISDQVEE
ncbi:MAG: hypothetical protein ACE5G0_05665 [Rhodothermales bacterium]